MGTDVSCVLTTPTLVSWLSCGTAVLQNVTTVGDWVKGARDLSVLFLTTAYESTITVSEKCNV